MQRKWLRKLKPAHEETLLLSLGTSQTFCSLTNLSVYNIKFTVFILFGPLHTVTNWTKNKNKKTHPRSLYMSNVI